MWSRGRGVGSSTVFGMGSGSRSMNSQPPQPGGKQSTEKLRRDEGRHVHPQPLSRDLAKV